MQKVILLSRVSTGHQDLEQQTETLIKYASNLGYKEDEILVIEDKESGVLLSEEERNGLIKLKEAISSGGIKDVVVYELSRIARTPKVLYSIRDYLIEHKVQLHCLNPSFKLMKQDGSIDESANVIFSLFCSLSENECYIRKQRFKRGKDKLRSQNKYTGGKICYGYYINENKDYVIKEDEAAVIRRIYKEYQTRTIREIAYDLMLEGIFNTSLNSAAVLVRIILNRELYTGAKSAKSGQVERAYAIQLPAIITRKDYEKAQEKIKERKTRCKTKSKHMSLCRGLVVDINGEELKPYVCHGKYMRIKYQRLSSETIGVSMDAIDKIAWYYTVQNYKSSPGELKNKLDETKDSIASLTYKIKALEKKANEEKNKLVKLEQRVLDGKVSEDTAEIVREKIHREIEKIKVDSHSLEARREDLRKYLSNLSSLLSRPLREQLEELPMEEKIKLVRQQIKDIIVISTGTFLRSFGIEFTSGDYALLDYDCKSKKLYDNGVEVKYQRATPN